MNAVLTFVSIVQTKFSLFSAQFSHFFFGSHEKDQSSL
jgi:hypothetical protein